VRTARTRSLWALTGLGLAGSLVIAVAGAELLRGRPITWWWTPGLGNTPWFYLGMVALCVAWLGLGVYHASADRSSPVRLLLIGGLWCLPLALGPSLFSRDMFSYLAQGSILHQGLDPYHQAPVVLSHLHGSRVLDAVFPFWRHTTAPYGPLFLGLASMIYGVVGANLIAAVLLLRGVELAGVVLLAVFVPRLARAVGGDPTRATWLAVISPLVLLEFVAAGHNDALMTGLLVAGVALALERRPLLGIAVCALAATIKLPAATGALFIAVAWARAAPRSTIRIAVVSAAAVAAVLGIVTLVTGLGLDWIAAGLSKPSEVRIAITPATAAGHSLASLLQSLGVSANAKSLESAAHVLALALAGGVAIVLCLRVRYENLVWSLGLLLLALVLGGPAAWPWYLTWSVALLVCCPPAQGTRWVPLAIVGAAFLIRPDGQLILSRESSPFVLALYAVAAVAVLAAWRRRPPHSVLQPRFAG
jgi:hypothetical protein